MQRPRSTVELWPRHGHDRDGITAGHPHFQLTLLQISADAAGGTTKVDDLITDLLSTYPDIAENSIRTYLSTPAFITKSGVVRRRTANDPWPPIPPLRTARGAFRNGANEIRLAITVTIDVLRGSGQSIRPTVAAALGVSPGQRRTFTSQTGALTVAWHLSSPNGSSLGSLRVLAAASGAGLGDTLVLVFGLKTASLDIVRIPADVTGLPRLNQILGRKVRKPVSALAASLNCPHADVAAVLRKRGDHDLAELITDQPQLL